MTYLEKYKEMHPDVDMSDEDIIDYTCPYIGGIVDMDSRCWSMHEDCDKCWRSEIPEIRTKTCLEQYKEDHDCNDLTDELIVDCMCPDDYLPSMCECGTGDRELCEKCWNRAVVPEIKTPERGLRAKAGVIDEAMPKILDSGDRTEFESGAVRDMRVGKGRCDLMPLDVVSEWYHCEHGDDGANPRRWVFMYISNFKCTGVESHLFRALEASELFKNSETMFLEVAKHFEEGCIKYGENNWRKGIPAKCYIDSAVRHYLKHMRGDRDEPHDRAFCWNILCCIWTIRHHPELNDYMKKEVESNG